MINYLNEQIYKTFIESDRYLLFLSGLKTTIIISIFATIIGVFIGSFVALIKVSHKESGKHKILNAICSFYVLLFRGTPVVVQLMLMYYVILKSVQNAVFVAIIGFGINSGAYVSEIIRAGINSVDEGQMEAGRSLGLSYTQTMFNVIMPQAIKNILPAIFNEFISLLKETSVAGYITVVDLTKSADLVRGSTFQPFFPLIAVALIYFIMVAGLSQVQLFMEKRFAKSDRN